jgi:peptidoglycan/xylan/chitin deacetylase (PgdA/CDA1 family)
MHLARDLEGYGRNPPSVRWPENARVAVSIVVNLEEGAELSLADGDHRNEGTYEVQDPIQDHPDLCARSHFDYGCRAGWWRIMDVLERFDVPATVSACGRAVERAPALAIDAVQRGHEVACHGWRWEPHYAMDEPTERAVIARTKQTIETVTGTSPVGWHTRSSPSLRTRHLLQDLGFLYDSDFYGDDLPVAIEANGRPYALMPYAFDTNDMHFHQGQQRFALARHFAEYVCDAFDCLWREGEAMPRLMSIGLHLRMIGRPGRIAALEAILRHLTAKRGIWLARRDVIARHWLASVGGSSAS